MKILVMGGSYFYGRVFTMSACEKHELTLLNRGTYPMNDYPVNEIKADRKNEEALRKALGKASGNPFSGERFDAVVDFSAYDDNDVLNLLEALGYGDPAAGPTVTEPPVAGPSVDDPSEIEISRGRLTYILISTADVLKHVTDEPINDDSPYEDADIPGQTGEYIKGKIKAEKALIDICNKNESIKGVILRPTVIYGPYDYSGRFASYVQTVINSKITFDLTDSDGSFDCIYIGDAVKAVMNAIDACDIHDKADRADAGKADNDIASSGVLKMLISSDERCSYKIIFDIFERELKKQGIEADKKSLSVKEAEELGLPLFFAPYDNESYKYDTKEFMRFRDSINAEPFTSLEEGLGKTFRFFL